ncbi:SusC/RagA family TonB-linked outer membrane protein [Echinicola vietnamensis]|uniref:TonB-linked outer membrane protein, SusC/RagA family n=1 Tax=Echinicola vietnamensis (strain DSM 17526 / LMG 23754 / KMM 6221) TaxID=926556 RepID=L0FZD9_ECHVK|nr:SusC/RagA family TonB-linked outer membrane protein [Echinicola vietnamensis]AGA78662.1 TonB-linked outer membrane protein, SusC/RagA family [Echinicola vietnamensis DSM 17526]
MAQNVPRKPLPKWLVEMTIPSMRWGLVFLLGIGLSISSFAQEVITGTVIDSGEGEPIPGASVLLKGTTTGTTTDFDGNFSISVPDGEAILVFSFIGYEKQEITVGNRSKIDVELVSSLTDLESVVVVGYGTMKKSDVTGAIAGVDSDLITERGTTSPVQSLQGSVAGVQVSNSTGRLGDGFNMTIRGNNSLAGSEPLYVVDGVVTNNIDFLNPNDIAKIEVLKDASSAAIYGSRAAGGVVIVETKGGTDIPDATTFSFDTFYGVKTPARLPEMMSLEQWRDYHMSAYLGTTNNGEGMTPQEYEDVVLGPNNPVLAERFNNLDGFDWYDAVLRNGMQTNNHLTISHRSGASTYNIGIGYQKETGTLEQESLDKYTFNMNINQHINDKFMAGANMALSHGTNQRGSGNAMQEAFRLNPFLSPWAIDENGDEIVGDLFPQPGKLTYPNGDWAANKTSTYNPLLEIANSSDETRSLRGVGNAYLQYDPLDWLSLKSTFSIGFNNNRRGRFWGAMTNTGINNGNLPSSEVSYYNNMNTTWDNQLNISKAFNDHSFNFLALQSIFVDRTERANMSSTQQPFETEFYNVGSGLQETYNLGNGFSKSQLASFALRLNYSYLDKYLVTVSNRWDGSSLLSEGNKWQAFPSVALGWRLNKEAFLANSSTVSDLKLRLGYGTVGNNNVSPYRTVNALTSQTYYDFNGTAANGWVQNSIANKALTWEKTKEINAGVDFGFLMNRITGSVDYYNRLSDNLLVTQKLPLEIGFSDIASNAASVRNKGVEVMLNTINVENSHVTWSTTFTFTKNTNSIESLYGQSEVDDVGNGWFIGESIDAHYNFIYDGVWQAGEDAAAFNQTEGQAKAKDVNNDGMINPNDDRVILGSSNPSWTGGIISNLQVGNFDMNFSLATQQGVLAYSDFHSNFTNVTDRGRQKLAIPNWYVPENSVGVPARVTNEYPQPRNEGQYWGTGMAYYKDASFVKINNIGVGYTLPETLLSRANLKKVRVYVNVLNPFTFTDYDGWDPEWAQASLGIGRVSTITTQFGLSVKF